jgi:hypothetical protein
MRRREPPRASAGACTRYSSLAGFYTADPRRVSSRELDVGLWWREELDGPLHRAAWVSDTGELYLVRLGPQAAGGGRVEVLARIDERERMEALLAGWRERCGEPRSLSWLRRRVARMGAAPWARTTAFAAPRLSASAGQSLRAPG